MDKDRLVGRIAMALRLRNDDENPISPVAMRTKLHDMYVIGEGFSEEAFFLAYQAAVILVS